MTKTQRLTQEINVIGIRYKDEISRLATSGPRGGRNAYNIPGWTRSLNGTVTKAVKAAGIRTLPMWEPSSFRGTPYTAIPQCICKECNNAYHDIFDK